MKDRIYEELLACLQKHHFDYAECQPQVQAQLKHETDVAIRERYSWKHLRDWFEAEGWRFIHCVPSLAMAVLTLISSYSFCSKHFLYIPVSKLLLITMIEAMFFCMMVYVSVYVD